MSSYEKFTLKMAIELAAPHTWAAAVMPVLGGAAFAYASTGVVLPFMSILLLIICVLMQSSVNAFNDYFDFVKGLDTKDDNVEESDSVLVYNNVNPKCALYLAIGMLASAFLLGILVIYRSGFIPLIIAAIGALAVVFYSAGKRSISSLPLGEIVSGFVMGELIPLATYYVITGNLDLLVLLWSIPYLNGIGMIMATNNICDIEKDEASGRKTLPTIIGREKARNSYRAHLILWVVAICAFTLIQSLDGWFILVFMIFAAIPLIKNLFTNPLVQGSRIAAMGSIVSLNLVLGAFYSAALFV